MKKEIKGKMILPRNSFHKVKDLPDGYKSISFSEQYKEGWISLFVDLNVFTKEQCDHFIQDDRETFKKYCVLVIDSSNTVVASAGLLKDDTNRLYLAYIGVKEEEQGKGIGSYLVSKVSYTYDTIPSRYPLYAPVSTQTYREIMLLSRLDYLPFMGEYNGKSEEESKQDWQEITEFLKEKTLKN